MTINDLPIEQQREIAKKIGWEDFDDFQKAMQNIGSIFKHFDEDAEKHCDYHLARERLVKRLEKMKEWPEPTVRYYQRMTDNYSLTEQDVIDRITRGIAKIDKCIAEEAAAR